VAEWRKLRLAPGAVDVRMEVFDLFNTIVWASDGSQHADRALEVAQTLAKDYSASLVVIHVVQRYATETGLAVYPDEDRVKAKLEETVQELSKDGLKASLRIVNHVGPQAAHQIADTAQQEGADLIVVGTRGHGPVTGLVLGSVVLRLLHVAPCPVVAVPGHPGDDRPS
jgi:nucleotide-binding universal stress UspA family protein